MRFFIRLCISIFICLTINIANSQEATPKIGTNLAGPADYNTELPFVDVFRMSRPWISQEEGAEWGKGPELDLDEHGWVKSLEPNAYAETLMCTIEGGHYPEGQYTVLYDGEGRMEFWGSAEVVSREPGKMIIDVKPEQGTIFLQLRETNPDNYVKNIRVIMPGFEDTYKANPWHPTFLKRWKGMACLRYMDFMHTNNSDISTWDERPKLDDATTSRKGIPLELLIDLANRQQSDPWFCMPHKVDDDYIRNFAQMVKDRLDPNLNIYVEYSNEVWNGIFSQHQYAGQKGIELGFAEKQWEGAWRYTAYRSVQIFNIWEEVFGSTERLIRVLPTQAANPYVSRQIVEFQEAFQHADALGIAPYISFNVSPNGDPSAEAVAQWPVDKAMDYMEQTALPQSKDWIRSQKDIADEFGLKLVAYEAGQHMVGIQGAENKQELTNLFHQCNSHPRMGDLYDSYYAFWREIGGDLLCNFSSVSRWSKWGSWGLLQFYDSDPTESPKFMVTMQWAEELDQSVNIPDNIKIFVNQSTKCFP